MAAVKWEISDGRREKSSRVLRARSTLTKYAQRGRQKLQTQPDLIYRLLEELCTCTGNWTFCGLYFGRVEMRCQRAAGRELPGSRPGGFPGISDRLTTHSVESTWLMLVCLGLRESSFGLVFCVVPSTRAVCLTLGESCLFQVHVLVNTHFMIKSVKLLCTCVYYGRSKARFVWIEELFIWQSLILYVRP